MKKFDIVANGYNVEEVNNFLNDVTREYENMLNNLKERNIKLKNLEDKLKKYEGMESVLNKAVMVAEDSANNIKKIAHDEAKMIIEDAKRNASRIVNDALLKAEKEEQEAEELKRRIAFYKRRIRQALQEQLSMVDDIDDIEY
ncbi:MAG: DivIVA domain-containing protein [Bacilli bacterium]